MKITEIQNNKRDDGSDDRDEVGNILATNKIIRPVRAIRGLFPFLLFSFFTHYGSLADY